MWHTCRTVLMLIGITLVCGEGCKRPEQVGARTDRTTPSEGRPDGYGSAVPLVDGAHESRRWAILVGINDYRDGWTPLCTAVNGAVHLRNMLRDEFGYDEGRTSLLLNVDGQTIVAKIHEVLHQVRHNDSVLLYFAGHGSNDGLLAGVDSTGERDTARGVAIRDLQAWFAAAPCLCKAIILDSCYSGRLFETAPPRGSGRTEAEIFVGLTAARGADVAFDGGPEADFSPFTGHLLNILTERANSQRVGHVFSFKRLADEVTARIAGETQGNQRPQWGFLGPGQGDFEFRETVTRATPLEREQAAKEHEERVARSQRLVVASQACRTSHPQRSLLLATEAVEIEYAGRRILLPEAHENLRTALGQIGGIPLRGHDGAVQCCVAGVSGRWLYTGGDDHTVRAWDLSDLEKPSTILVKHRDRVNDVAVRADGRLLASASADGSIRIVHLDNAEPTSASKRETRLHNSWVTDVTFSHDGRWLASASNDGVIRLWDVSGDSIPEFPILLKRDGAQRAIDVLSFSTDSKQLAAGDEEGTVCLWPVDRAKLLLKVPSPVCLEGHKDGIPSLAVSPNGGVLVTGDGQGVVRLWDLHKSDPAATVKRLAGHDAAVNGLAFTPDGENFVSVASDNLAKLWRVEAMDAPTTMAGHTDSIRCVAMSPEGTYVATGSTDQTIRIWSMVASDVGAEPTVLRGHEGRISAICFSRDGKWLFSGCADGTIRRWPVAEGTVHGASAFSGEYAERCTFAASSPSGRWFVKGQYWDNEVVLEQREEGRVVSCGQMEIAVPDRARFSPDERWLIVGVETGPPVLFDLRSESHWKLEGSCRISCREGTANSW